MTKHFKSPYHIHHIPTVLHRTLLWDDAIPKEVEFRYNKFNYKNRHWKLRLWRNDDVIALCEKYQLVDVYNSYQYNIQKADFARYLIIYDQGGCYCDFDVESKYSLNKIARTMSKTQSLTLVTEACGIQTKNIHLYTKKDDIEKRILSTEEKRIWKEDNNTNVRAPHRIANYFLLAKKQSLEMFEIIKLCIRRAQLEVTMEYDVLYTTGPDVVSAVYHNLIREKREQSVNVLHKKYITHTGVGVWKKQW